MTKTKNTPIPEKLKQSKLAEHFEVSSRRIRTLETEGYFERDENGFYDVKEVAQVFANMDSDRRVAGRVTNAKAPSESSPWNGEGQLPALAESKARKEFFAAEVTRARAQKLLGELVERETVEATLNEVGAATMTAFRNFQPKLAPYLTDEGKKQIAKMIDDSLRGIARDLEKLLADQEKATGAEA